MTRKSNRQLFKPFMDCVGYELLSFFKFILSPLGIVMFLLESIYAVYHGATLIPILQYLNIGEHLNTLLESMGIMSEATGYVASLFAFIYLMMMYMLASTFMPKVEFVNPNSLKNESGSYDLVLVKSYEDFQKKADKSFIKNHPIMGFSLVTIVIVFLVAIDATVVFFSIILNHVEELSQVAEVEFWEFLPIISQVILHSSALVGLAFFVAWSKYIHAYNKMTHDINVISRETVHHAVDFKKEELEIELEFQQRMKRQEAEFITSQKDLEMKLKKIDLIESDAQRRHEVQLKEVENEGSNKKMLLQVEKERAKHYGSLESLRLNKDHEQSLRQLELENDLMAQKLEKLTKIETKRINNENKLKERSKNIDSTLSEFIINNYNN